MPYGGNGKSINIYNFVITLKRDNMTIRTFWAILLKVLGIWLIIGGVSVSLQLVSTLFTFMGEDFTANLILMIIFIFLSVAIYMLILWIFVFKTSWLIDKLHLEKDFEEKTIGLKIKATTILQIATIVIGGIMLIDALPQLCKEMMTLYQQKIIFRQSTEMPWLILYLVKFVIGILLMSNSEKIVALIEKESKKEESK